MHVPAQIDLSAIPEEQRDAVAALLREHGALVGENSALKGETSSLRETLDKPIEPMPLDLAA